MCAAEKGAAPRTPALRSAKPPAADRAAAHSRKEEAHAARPRSARASLTITSTPAAYVLIDGRPRGATPLHSVRVRPGTHRVTLVHGRQRKTLMVRGDAGETALVSARFNDDEPAEPTSDTSTSGTLGARDSTPRAE